jgi:hypothetical protein
MSQCKLFDGIALWSRGDTILIVWQTPARIHRLKWLFEQIDAVAARNLGGIVVLQLVLSTSSPPDGPAREENQVRMRRLGASLRRLVTVPLGDALWMSIVRAIMRGLTLVSGQSKSQFVASSEAEGLDLLMKAAGPSTPSRRELSTELDELYRALGVPRTAPAAA